MATKIINYPDINIGDDILIAHKHIGNGKFYMPINVLAFGGGLISCRHNDGIIASYYLDKVELAKVDRGLDK